jgi:hypothetical protein
MGDGGLMRAAGLQIAGAVESDIIGPSTGSTDYTTCAWGAGWCRLEVLSSAAVLAAVTAPSVHGATKINSGSTYPQNWHFDAGKITGVRFATKTTGYLLMAHRRILL